VTARLATHPDIAGRTAHVVGLLRAAGMDVEFVGDLHPAEPFAGLGDHQIDLALVGITALRGNSSDDFTTVAVLPRMDTRDVLVALQGRATSLARLSEGARVAYSGARRGAFLAAHRGDIVGIEMDAAPFSDLMGLAREGEAAQADSSGLAEGAPDALIMSALDAREGGLLDTAVEALDPKSWLPEPGQGALALVARHPIAEATALDHLPTRTALRTELALLDAIESLGTTTLGCLAQPSGRWIRLWAAAASSRGDRLVRSDRTGPLDEPESLGASVASELMARGYGLLAAPTSP